MKRIIFLIVFCLGTVFGAFGQTQEITEGEYWGQYRLATGKPFEKSKRIVTKEENYGEKYSYTREIIDEFLNPDRRRYVETHKEGKRTSKIELIQIGEIFYCRTIESAWKQSEKWCGPMRLSSLPGAKTSKFTVEETKINNRTVKLYQQYVTYKNEYFSTKDREAFNYLDDKFWVDGNGFIFKREWEIGLLEPKKIFEKRLTTYEYNLKDLKIEAPIK